MAGGFLIHHSSFFLAKRKSPVGKRAGCRHAKSIRQSVFFTDKGLAGWRAGAATAVGGAGPLCYPHGSNKTLVSGNTPKTQTEKSHPDASTAPTQLRLQRTQTSTRHDARKPATGFVCTVKPGSTAGSTVYATAIIQQSQQGQCHEG